MNIAKLFQERSKAFYLFLVVLGLVRSVTNIGILILIRKALGHQAAGSQGTYNAWFYFGLIVVSFFCTRLFQRYMVRFTNDMMYSLEIRMLDKVRNASYESFEKMGNQKIYAAIGDSRSLSRIPEVAITLINSIITIVCSLSYLFWTSPWGGTTVLVVMTILLLFYLYRDGRIRKDMNTIRDLQDGYYGSLRELLLGFKQIRISSLRNNNLFNEFLLANRNKTKELSISTSQRYLVNELTGVYSWYLLLGIIIFLLPVLLKLDVLQVAAFITAILFMIGPISQLVMFLPVYNSFKIAIERIDAIDKQLESEAQRVEETGHDLHAFKTIRFEQVQYQYEKDEENTFVLDLPDFTVYQGEILFITGGNGSGKTTFINLLTGLCKPQSGKIYMDEQELSWEDFYVFNNKMAVVFNDHYMFNENYDKHDFSEENMRLQYLTTLSNLDGILKINAEKNYANTKLSKGQQKRLALLLALLEDKPIVILDEWAAEQDPYNRKYFYTEMLQLIRHMGKTVIAISHDDDFYSVADRVVKFNYGKITSDTKSFLKIVQA